jgi:hypothetical protein
MKIRFPAAVALSFAMTQLMTPIALAQTPASPFRSVEAQTFSAGELQQYGLTADEAARVETLQQQGYEVQLMTAEEAEAMNAGMTTNNVLAIVGLVVIVLVVASAL